MPNNLQKVALVSYWKDIDSIRDSLKKYSAIFATEQAALDLHKAGVKIEAVISDFDTVEHVDATIAELTKNTLVMVLPKEKDMSDTKAMVTYIMEKYPACEIDLFNSFDGRADHALVLLSLFTTCPPLTIFTGQTLIRLLHAGKQLLYPIKGYNYISFISFEEVHQFRLENFKYDTEQAYVPIFSDFLVSNEFLGEQPGTVTFEKGRALVIYSRD